MSPSSQSFTTQPDNTLAPTGAATVEVRTPCRLHFGLLALSHDPAHRQYGGAGVMIQRPDIVLRITPQPDHEKFTAVGPLATEALGFAQTFTRKAIDDDLFTPIQGGRIEILRAPRPHTGLGTGTQLGLAVARGLAILAGQHDLELKMLAALAGRGRRSAIGAYGFEQGGFIVEGGKLDRSRLSPLLLRHDFPEDWRLVLVSPRSLQGLAGAREVQAFATLPDITAVITGQMCRLVLLGLTPAIIERDLQSFGRSLYELQHLVGQCFSKAQGGIWADPLLEAIVNQLRNWGVDGVGQSSWGPTLYAVVGDEQEAQSLASRLGETFDLGEDEVTITAANNHGGTWSRVD